MKFLSPAVMIATGLWCAGLMADDEPSRWDNFYVEGAAGAGRSAALGGVSLFGPLYSTEEGFLYTDLRGIWGDNLDAVQSYGFGGRFQDYHDLIRGVYAFYDRHQSSSDTTHQQLTIGAELLGVEWDFRINAYLPNKSFSQSHTFGDLDEGRVVVRGLTEASYYGADTEFGYLLDEWRDGQIELRGYVGGYWFDRNYDGFESFAGPRARAELRLFDLEWLGPGSRLVAAGQADWNRRDKTQLTAMLTLRVPLQFKNSKPLSRLDRRMLNPIARWPGVFLNTLWTVEPAAFADGRAISETLTINANTPDPATAVNELPPNSLVIIDGNEGTIELRNTIEMPEGQTLVGGEGFFDVVGRTTGGRGQFVAPGVRPWVDQTVSSVSAIQLPERHGQVLGLNVYSENDGIVGENTINTTVAGNFITGSNRSTTAHGIWLQGNQRNLQIHANLIAGNDNGIRIDGDARGEIADNLIGANGWSGVYVEGDLHADLIHNLIGDNGHRGVLVKGDLIGDVRDNRFDDNGQDGLHVLGDVRGDIADNVATGNAGTGFLFEGNVQGDLTGNGGSDNDDSGFAVLGTMNGAVRNNVARSNVEYGMHFAAHIAGDLADNHLWENGRNGLYAEAGVQGAIRANSISENGSLHGTTSEKSGLLVVGSVGGPIEDNEFLSNGGFGAFLKLDGPQTVHFERNELSENHSLRGDLFVGSSGGPSGPIVIHLKDNTSEAADRTYPYKTYQRAPGIEFIDDGGNEGWID